MFLENNCTFYDRQITLHDIVLLRSSLTPNAQAAHQRDLEKVRQTD